jgi:transglutaminase-like putative cysteine protease
MIEVTHRTVFEYDADITETVMELRLQPVSDDQQRCQNFRLLVEPRGSVTIQTDRYGNSVHVFNYRLPHRRVVAEAQSIVNTGLMEPTATTLSPADRFRLCQFNGPVVDLPAVRDLASACGLDRADTAEATLSSLDALTELINARFEYQPQTTTVASTVADLIVNGRGVCQDFTHLWIAVCRSRGVPARYVSGYVHGEGTIRGGGASHAWAEAWLPGLGWLGYDPTNPVRVGSYHVKVAVGADYRDVSPTKGMFRGQARERLEVDVRTRDLTSSS